MNEIEMAINQCNINLTRADDGTFILDSDAIVGVDRHILENLRLSLEETNRLIRCGEIDPTQIVIDKPNFQTKFFITDPLL